MKLKEYWIVLVETFACEKHGPYYSEQEVDEEAKVLVRKLIQDSPKRAQNLRILLMELTGKGFEVSLYSPEFLLDLIK